MLTIVVPESEMYDSAKNEFITIKSQQLVLEHSLISISKWEEKWKKPFLTQKQMTREQTVDYIRCMTVNKVDDTSVYLGIQKDQMEQSKEYIEDPATATSMKEKKSSKKSGKRDKRIPTSEELYARMAVLNIPFECAKWRLNRLLALIKLTGELNDYSGGKGGRAKKDPQSMAKIQALNARRRAAMGSKG